MLSGERNRTLTSTPRFSILSQSLGKINKKDLLAFIYGSYVAFCAARISLPLAKEFSENVLNVKSNYINYFLLIPTSIAPEFSLSLISNIIFSISLMNNLSIPSVKSVKRFSIPVVIVIISGIPSINVSVDLIPNKVEKVINAIGLFLSALGVNGRFLFGKCKLKNTLPHDILMSKAIIFHLLKTNPVAILSIIDSSAEVKAFLQLPHDDIMARKQVCSEVINIFLDKLDHAHEIQNRRKIDIYKFIFIVIAAISALSNFSSGFSSTKLFGTCHDVLPCYIAVGLLIGLCSAVVNAVIHIAALAVVRDNVIALKHEYRSRSLGARKTSTQSICTNALFSLLLLYFSLGFAFRGGGFAWVYPFPSKDFFNRINESNSTSEAVTKVVRLLESSLTAVCSFVLAIMSLQQFTVRVFGYCYFNASYQKALKSNQINLTELFIKGGFFTRRSIVKITTEKLSYLFASLRNPEVSTLQPQVHDALSPLLDHSKHDENYGVSKALEYIKH